MKKGEFLGVIPAGGRGNRIAPLPCSKELFPIGYRRGPDGWIQTTRVVSDYLLEKFRLAGITKTYILLRKGKWDIPAYFSDGKRIGMHLAYLVVGDNGGPPFTVNEAYPFLISHNVAFGFPDILFSPHDAFKQLMDHQQRTESEVVLGLVPAHDSTKMDMVDADQSGRIHYIHLKPQATPLSFAWICAVWTPTFTQFMHEVLSGDAVSMLSQFNRQDIDPGGDLPLGAIIALAVQKGLRVDGVRFLNAEYVDIGTPEGLQVGIQQFAIP